MMEPLHVRLIVSLRSGSRAYRLIDAFLQPHPHLDGHYDSIEDAMAEAVGWLAGLEPPAGQACIGLEVSTSLGEWRTIRIPVQLLCSLPREC